MLLLAHSYSTAAPANDHADIPVAVQYWMKSAIRPTAKVIPNMKAIRLMDASFVGVLLLLQRNTAQNRWFHGDW
jgi:hypothetical protein